MSAPTTQQSSDSAASEASQIQQGKVETADEAKGEEEPTQATPPVKEMRAVLLNSFGGLKSMKIAKRPEPVLCDGEVLIRVQLCGVSFQDVMVRQGVTEPLPKTPFILGFECAGIVEQIADDVDTIKVGERVVALADHRAWAELVPVAAKFVYPVPETMPLQEAAAVTLSYTVANFLVHDFANITPGNTIMLHSAGGSVGLAVGVLCQQIGGVTIVGIASECKHEAIKSYFTHVVERGPEMHNEVKKLCPDGVDVVMDCLGGDECNKAYQLLKPCGRYILFGSSSIVTGETKSIFSVAKSWWQVEKVSPLKLYDDNKAIIGFNFRKLLHQQVGGAERVRAVVERVYRLWQEGVVKAHIDSTHALEDVTEAMAKMHERRNIGKLLLDLSMEPKPPKPSTPAKTKKDQYKEKESEKKEGDKKEEKDKEESKENGKSKE